MSQCDRVLEVLRDGHWHTISEIHQKAGTMRLNSRISELREKRNLVIECAPAGPNTRYRLLGELAPTSEAPPTASSLHLLDGSMHAHAGGRGASEAGAEPLFEITDYGTGGKPEWA